MMAVVLFKREISGALGRSANKFNTKFNQIFNQKLTPLSSEFLKLHEPSPGMAQEGDSDTCKLPFYWECLPIWGNLTAICAETHPPP
jgi:hypothetical protein